MIKYIRERVQFNLSGGMRDPWSTFKKWLPFGLVITVSIATSYAMACLTLRMLADDPQVEITKNIAAYMEQGAQAEQLGLRPAMQVETGMGTYVVIYDLSKTPIAGSATLKGALPELPRGLFDHAIRKGEHRVTWEPIDGNRQAAVLRYQETPTPVYILAARSLSETESRQDMLCSLALFAWGMSMLASFGLLHLFRTKIG